MTVHHLNGVQPLIRLVHCAAHRLNLVLCLAASAISPVKVFFSNVSSFSSFTSVSSKRKVHFTSHNIEIETGRVPSLLFLATHVH